MDEAALIRRILSGEQETYAELVRAHQAKVLRLCFSLLGDNALAEDAAQEVFIKAYQRLASFKGQAAFGTWLYRIATNTCLDFLRKRQREKTQSWDELIEDLGEEVNELLPSPTDPAGQLANKQLAQLALSKLSPEFRLVLMLREMEGLSYQEMAETLDCSLDAVKARLKRARKAMLQQLRHFLRAENV